MSEPANGLEWFGREVEAALEHAGATGQQLADATGYKPPYVSKVKNGKALPSLHFARGCDAFFNTSGYFERMLTRISEYGHPEWFVPYLQLEKRASQVLDFSSYLAMGILQTSEYATALFKASNPRLNPEQIAEKVGLRLQRRNVIERETPPLLWVVLDESVIHRQVGGRRVMSKQMEHLAEVAENPNIVLQVLPYDSGAPSVGEPFTLLTFDDDSDPVVYSEAQGIGRVIDSASVVRTAQERYERLRADALSPDKTLRVLREASKEYTQ